MSKIFIPANSGITAEDINSGKILTTTTTGSMPTWSIIDERLPIYIQDAGVQYFDPQDYYRITQLALEIWKKEQEYKAEFKELIK